MATLQTLQFTKALADETRLRLVRVLMEHELSVGELVHALGLLQSRISRHLKILAGAGLVVSRRDGQWVYYSLPEEGAPRDFLTALSAFLENDEALDADAEAAARVVAERAQRSVSFFDSHAGRWDELRESALGGLDLSALVLERVGSARVAVDLGCGTGALLGALHTRIDTVIGVDNVPRMLEQARESFGGDSRGVSLRIGDLEHLPLRDAEADFAAMCLALHHLPSPERGIAETHRILEEDGTFVLVDFEQHDDERLREEAGDHWLGFAPERIERWLQVAGFAIVDNTRLELASGLALRLYEARKRHLEELS